MMFAVLCTPIFGQTTSKDWLNEGNTLYNQSKYDEAIPELQKSIELKGVFWFEAFNISDKLEMIDISKAKKFLGYSPN